MTSIELQQARRTLRMTQKELATALGIARNTIARWEMGDGRIPVMTQLSVEWLLRESAREIGQTKTL